MEIREEILEKIIAGYLGCDPAQAKVAVSGVVTLAGHVEKKSMIRLAVGMSRAVNGVVDVIDHLRYTGNDTRGTQAPEPLARWLSVDLEHRLGGGDRYEFCRPAVEAAALTRPAAAMRCSLSCWRGSLSRSARPTACGG